MGAARILIVAAFVAQCTAEPVPAEGVASALLADDQCAGNGEKQEHCGLNALQRATATVESKEDATEERFLCGVIYCEHGTECCKSGNGMDGICIASGSTCCRS